MHATYFFGIYIIHQSGCGRVLYVKFIILEMIASNIFTTYLHLLTMAYYAGMVVFLGCYDARWSHFCLGSKIAKKILKIRDTTAHIKETQRFLHDKPL